MYLGKQHLVYAGLARVELHIDHWIVDAQRSGCTVIKRGQPNDWSVSRHVVDRAVSTSRQCSIFWITSIRLFVVDDASHVQALGFFQEGQCSIVHFGHARLRLAEQLKELAR